MTGSCLRPAWSSVLSFQTTSQAGAFLHDDVTTTGYRSIDFVRNTQPSIRRSTNRIFFELPVTLSVTNSVLSERRGDQLGAIRQSTVGRTCRACHVVAERCAEESRVTTLWCVESWQTKTPRGKRCRLLASEAGDRIRTDDVQLGKRPWDALSLCEDKHLRPSGTLGDQLGASRSPSHPCCAPMRPRRSGSVSPPSGSHGPTGRAFLFACLHGHVGATCTFSRPLLTRARVRSVGRARCQRVV